MTKTRELLMKDYNDAGDIMTVVGKDSPDRDTLLRERDNIRNELIKLDSIEMDAKLKNAEIAAENKREKIRTGVTIGTFVITSMISVWAVIKTFRFDEEGTVTSTLGRGILGNILPKLKK